MATAGPQNGTAAAKNQISPAPPDIPGGTPRPSDESSLKDATAITLEVPVVSSNSAVALPPEVLPSLECLVGVSKISWQQATNVEVLRPHKLNRRYSLEDQSGQILFYAGEKVGIICDLIGQGQRAFCINVYDIDGALVLKFVQHCSSKLCLMCAECGGGRVEVVLANGKKIGAVGQITTCCTPTYEILDAVGNREMIIVGKCGRVCCLCPSKAFRVFADVLKDSSVITEVVATTGRRYVEFKEEMTLEFKILLMATMLLLEMDYYRSCRGLRRILILVLLLISAALWYRITELTPLDDQATV